MDKSKYNDRLEDYSLDKLYNVAKRNFNKSIVLRDLYRNERGELIAQCISCGRKTIINSSYDLKKFVAGHYFRTFGFTSVEFDRDNVNIQCSQYCNVNMSGNLSLYQKSLVVKIGQERFDVLKAKAQKTHKLTYRELINIIIESREIIARRKKELHIKF